MIRLSICFLLISLGIQAQPSTLSGHIRSESRVVDGAAIQLSGTRFSVLADSLGSFSLGPVPAGTYTLVIRATGYEPFYQKIILKPGTQHQRFDLLPRNNQLNDVVVSGTLREVKRGESPVPVEVYTPAFFKKNPTPNIFDALQQVNGVRPQLNCNICNTGDIHMNGLEGPYTMVLIDGMPIVSSLASVYGLSGIPNALVERIEIVKGPASSLYGSEAVGGLINIITREAARAPKVSADLMYTSWDEWTGDLGFRTKLGKNINILTGLHAFHYQHRKDENNDGFTDVTLQKQQSFFQKWSWQRPKNRIASLAARYYKEDRWGGDLRWSKRWEGSDSIYGESITTHRWEITGAYALPVPENMVLRVSFNDHRQNSWYGIVPFQASQQILFGQLTWDKKISRHNILAGIATRYTGYDDNSPATASADTSRFINQPQRSWIPGVFIQDEWKSGRITHWLLGMRYDHHPAHGAIITPRLAIQWKFKEGQTLRLNAGTGFRVVNLFTEDHAALTGARKVVILDELKPERSYNINLNYLHRFMTTGGTIVSLDMTGWYTHFSNRIIGDYTTDPNQIIYSNLKGHATSVGLSLNTELSFMNGIKTMAGFTWQDVTKTEQGKRTRQLLTEQYTGTWSVSYTIRRWNMSVDYTGNLYGPMHLPLLGPLDPRSPQSPWWSIQNIQLVFKGRGTVEWYTGVKNLLNWTPAKSTPFLIAGAQDPFDKKVQFNSSGQVMATADNPYALSFDPNYVYAPNQGIRWFVGMRVQLR